MHFRQWYNGNTILFGNTMVIFEIPCIWKKRAVIQYNSITTQCPHCITVSCTFCKGIDVFHIVRIIRMTQSTSRENKTSFLRHSIALNRAQM